MTENATGDKPLGSVLAQVKSTMLVTLWDFIGIEGAVVMCDKSDAKTVSRATLRGFFVTVLRDYLEKPTRNCLVRKANKGKWLSA